MTNGVVARDPIEHEAFACKSEKTCADESRQMPDQFGMGVRDCLPIEASIRIKYCTSEAIPERAQVGERR